MDEDYELLLVGFANFINFMRGGKTVDQAVSAMNRLVGEDLTRKVVGYWKNLVNDVASAEGLALIKGIGAAEAWYPGPQAVDTYWPSLRSYLLNNPKRPWGQPEVDELDQLSSTVLASCRSPWDAESSGRGLVVGYVQSGKTTNFTAVIAKAADAGFRLFIVLSGTTKSLRRQTQKRLEEQLAELNPHAWYFHTELDADIGSNTNWVPFLRQAPIRTCIVVKKNKKRLKNLIKCLDRAQSLGILDDCPIMVIDDEGDQASLSPQCDNDKATAINKLIVEVLTRPRISYVAYTATPFANFFVNAYYPENLYPRDFILSLAESDSYFGSRKLFGASGDPEISSVIDISEVEANGYLPPPPVDSKSLTDAIKWFLMSATVRRLRNNGVQPHTSMLVNVSEKILVHTEYWKIVRNMVVELSLAIRNNDSVVRSLMTELWRIETSRVQPSDFGYEPTSFDLVWHEITKTIDLLGPLNGVDHNSHADCAIVVDNSESAFRLAYDDDEPRPVIVIGGNTLSRGLTLEGLVSTFFLRSTRLYDTLLQMGRWFGFRPGYEDLFRIWMPIETREKFEFLARVELELRDWIELFARTGKTPLELGPRIAAHPSMLITRAAMMRDYKRVVCDLSGTQPETSIFENTTTATSQNRSALIELVASLLKTGSGETVAAGHLFRDIDVSSIQHFFRPDHGYNVVGHPNLSSTVLLNYITTKIKHDELQNWNIGFRAIRGGKPVDFLPGINATFSGRSRKSISGDNLDIGSLAFSGDKAIDIPQGWSGDVASYRVNHPLLVVYVIDKDSKPDAKGLRHGRTDLDAVDHLIGLALFIPQSQFADPDLQTQVRPIGPWDELVEDLEVEIDPDEDDEKDAVGRSS